MKQLTEIWTVQMSKTINKKGFSSKALSKLVQIVIDNKRVN